jgi:dihydrodipicolinate synthase/N-acetylneuraminate lyase
MKTTPVTVDDLRGVLAVPPLPRKTGPGRPLDFREGDKLFAHMAKGGLTRFLYGGNAFLYHVTLGEYEELLGWLSGIAGEHWMIPSIGPSFGRAMDQAALLRRHRFPCVMALPCADPRDAAGLETGLREIAAAAGCGLILYLKEEGNFGADKEAGLDVVARLVADKICVAIKYAVVRSEPERDPYLDALLARVDRSLVVSGIGERPAIVHMRDFKLPGFTTGSGCLAPALSTSVFRACTQAAFGAAEEWRALFLPLEDTRDGWGPARVLHAALELAGVAASGPIPPFLTALSEEQRAELLPIAQGLCGREMAHRNS